MSYKDITHFKPMYLKQATYYAANHTKPTLCGKKGKRYNVSWNLKNINCPLCLEKLLNTSITVCDSCLRASCWQGSFMCENHKSAGTTTKTIRELKELGKENSFYWLKTIK